MKKRANRLAGQSGLTLIELLVGLIIGTIVSTMLLVVWFGLQQSTTISVAAATTRDDARTAVARMEREIRDAQAPPATNPYPALYRARPYWISFFTTFNISGNATPGAVTPHLVVYRLYSDKELWRFSGPLNTGNVNASLNISWPDSNSHDTPTYFPLSEEVNGQGATLVASNVTNFVVSPAQAIFTYDYYDIDGHLHGDTAVIGDDQRTQVIAAQIHLLVDLNPTKAPAYVDFQTTAQLRNQRAL